MRHLILVLLLVLSASVEFPQPAFAAPPPAGQAETKASPAPVVNINTAPVDQLERLPGVGPATAARIVEYRQKNGGFKKIEELMNVRGIGEKVFLRMKNQLTVSAAKVDQQ